MNNYWSIIFSLLQPKDICAVALCNKTWYINVWKYYYYYRCNELLYVGCKNCSLETVTKALQSEFIEPYWPGNINIRIALEHLRNGRKYARQIVVLLLQHKRVSEWIVSKACNNKQLVRLLAEDLPPTQ